MTLERLVELLEEVNNSAITPRRYLDGSHHSAVPHIQGLLNGLLITKGGNLDWDAKDELESHGFQVYPVERDRSGWLIGAVVTEKGDITFG